MGVADRGSVEVKSDDPWIPLTVWWWPRRQSRPLYLLVSGRDGGQVEFKADPDTGALLELVVLEEPPVLPECPNGALQAGGALVNKVPMLDRSPWGLRSDGSEHPADQRPVFIDVEGLAMCRSKDVVVRTFSSDAITTRLHCDRVTVGISDAQSLVSIEVRTGPSDER